MSFSSQLKVISWGPKEQTYRIDDLYEGQSQKGLKRLGKFLAKICGRNNVN